jgi:hypothetical protein
MLSVVALGNPPVATPLQPPLTPAPWLLAGIASSSGGSGSELPELVVCGRPSVSVASLAAGASAVVQLSMVGLQLGFVRSPALLLQQGHEAQPLDCIPEFVVMVEPG